MKALTCVYRGEDKSGTLELLQNIKSNTVPQNWMYFFHSTSGLYAWISDVTRKIFSLEEYISHGIPASFSSQDIFSTRALIRTFQMIYATGQNVALDQTAVVLHHSPEVFALPSLKIEGVKVVGSSNISETISLCIKYQNTAMRENLKAGEQIVELSTFGNNTCDESILPFQISCNNGTSLFFEDPTRNNEVFKFKIDQEFLEFKKDTQPLYAFIDSSPQNNYLLEDLESKSLLSSIELSHHVSIFLSSSADTENEREYITETVLPRLRSALHKNKIDIQFTDMRSDDSFLEANFNDTILASASQIQRSEIFIGIYGAKLGSSAENFIPGSNNRILDRITCHGKKTICQIEAEFSQEERDVKYIRDKRLCFFYLRGIYQN